MSTKRYTYILLQEEGCRIITAETSIKKIVDKFGKELQLPTYQHLSRLVRTTKDEGGEARFKNKEGAWYKIAGRRLL